LQGSPAPSQRGQQQGEPQQKNPRQHATQRSTPWPPPQQGAPAVPRAQSPPGESKDVQKAAPAPAPTQRGGPAVQGHRQQPPQGTAQREQPAPRPHVQQEGPQGQPVPVESKEERRHEPVQGQVQEKGQGHNK
jgi:hypothetical protein